MLLGKGTGIVTTTRVTHATPAAAYAHAANRHWETDADLPDDAKGTCSDVAHQLVVDNSNINVSSKCNSQKCMLFVSSFTGVIYSVRPSWGLWEREAWTPIPPMFQLAPPYLKFRLKMKIFHKWLDTVFSPHPPMKLP